MNLFQLAGRVAVVTGGNGGIGLGIALGLARAGATVVIAARSVTKNAVALGELERAGSRAIAIESDLRKGTAARDIVSTTVERCGRLDILVNNAGTTVRKPPQDCTPEEWDRVLDTNLSSAFRLSQAVYPAMLNSGGGKIINIGSMMSLFGAAYAVPYGASKGGIVQMTRGLACAWAKDNIQVNAILPGWIDTDFTHAARQQVPGLHERVIARCPAGRWGTPQDFAGIAVFLAGPASDFVTGTAIPVDGGYSSQV